MVENMTTKKLERLIYFKLLSIDEIRASNYIDLNSSLPCWIDFNEMMKGVRV